MIVLLDRCPELAESISQHLAQADLCLCVRVSKHWHSLFIRYLWETFSDNLTGEWHRHLVTAARNKPLDDRDINWFRNVYRRHAGFIRHLEITHPLIIYACYADAFRLPLIPSIAPESLDSKSSVMTRLRSLAIKFQSFSIDEYLKNELIYNKTGINDKIYTNEIILAEACWRLALCNRRLESFDCSMFRSLQRLFTEHPMAMQSVKALTMSLSHGRVPFIPSYITRLNSSMPRKEQFDPRDSPGLVNHTLKELYIKDEVRTIAHIKSLLIQLPSLRYLRLRRVNIKEHSQTGDDTDLEMWAPNLRVLQCGLYERKSPELVRIFPWMPNLVKFHHSYVSSPFTAALAKHCPLLEVVRVTYKGCRYTPRYIEDSIHDRVSILLTSCTKLKILDLQYETIDARKVAEKPWVCLNLEMFRCGFAGFPYLKDSDQEKVKAVLEREAAADKAGEQMIERTPEETALLKLSEEATSMRKGVLHQISMLTSLKHLTLSRDLKVGRGLFLRHRTTLQVYRSERDGKQYFRYNEVLPDTLYLRLDAGLQTLASLKKLELFGFESMDHRMGPDEIKWIARTFPMLKVVRGLAVHTHVGAERDPQMDALRELMQTLRPDIVHSSSFLGYERQVHH
ncbi:hypothetical protein FBU30_002701 [Linnemannia zychae]|nr:hypothetical protein FBU30_002701 [Linnemannia zychae]